NAFIEVKQKFKNVVNKRRSTIPLGEAYDILSHPYNEQSIANAQASTPQILRAALHVKALYHLQPAAAVSYERQPLSGQADYETDFILMPCITYNRQLLLVMIGKRLAERLIQRRICELHLIITSCVVLIILVSKMAQRDILLLTTILKY